MNFEKSVVTSIRATTIAALLLLLPLLLTACSSVPIRVYWALHREEVNLRVSDAYQPVRFQVEQGDPARIIGQKLKDAGLINDDVLFEAYVRTSDVSTRLAAGTFILSPDMTMAEIVADLLQADAASVIVTIREGWRVEQVADSLATANVFNDTVNGVSLAAEEYRRIATTGDTSVLDIKRYPFLESRPAGTSLEGYLFPDTYLIPVEKAIATDLLARQLDAFAQRVMPAYEAAVAAGKTQSELHSVLTLASIVEREAVVAEERPTIAGVYLNRLAQGIKLEADPTVQYAMGFQPASGQWWKTPVFLEEYGAVDSPYNTYLYAGLPPGPISNAGLSSIQAVVEPAQHNYLYFVALPDKSGRHVFATTFAEHQQNVARYLSGQ